jgi:hypothetical protein
MVLEARPRNRAIFIEKLLDKVCVWDYFKHTFMTRITIHISEPAKKLLKELSEEVDLPVGEIIRRAIAEYLRSSGK